MKLPVMSVLRMIKLFGWEKRAQGDAAAKREVELTWVWKRALYELINNNVKYVSNERLYDPRTI